MPSAEIIVIGTELVLGQIQDSNTRLLANSLNAIGVDVYRSSMVGDNVERIANEIKSSVQRADIVITTGGLGPTVDDPTRQAVSLAFNLPLKFQPELWKQIKDRFRLYKRKPTANNKKQAFIPRDFQAIENPVGTAPAFYIDHDHKLVFSLPGVPAEMEYLLKNKIIPIIMDYFKIESTIYSRIIHTVGIGESSLDEKIEDLEGNTNPTIGLSAHPGQVDIRITAKSKNRASAMKLIRPFEKEIRNRLKDRIYGYDNVLLEDVVKKLLMKNNIAIGLLIENEFSILAEVLKNTWVFNEIAIKDYDSQTAFYEDLSLYNDENRKKYVLNIKKTRKNKRTINLQMKSEQKDTTRTIHFGGSESLFNSWAKNQVLDFIRETISK